MDTDSLGFVRNLEIGQRVRIKKGAFAGKDAVIVDLERAIFQDAAEASIVRITVEVRALDGEAGFDIVPTAGLIEPFPSG
jgi:hypothetical protein